MSMENFKTGLAEILAVEEVTEHVELNSDKRSALLLRLGNMDFNSIVEYE